MIRTFTAAILMTLLSVPTLAAAQAPSYATLIDASATEALFEVKDLGSEEASRFRCSLSTLACKEADAGEDLIPEALEGERFYYLSPANDQVVITRFVPNVGPTHTLYRVEDGELTGATRLPIALDITRVRFSEDQRVLIITQADGRTVRYDTHTSAVTPVTALPTGTSWLSVSPNGRYVAYYLAATQSRGMRTFGVVDTVTDRAYTFDEQVAYWDLLSEGSTLFAFSPDSSSLLYLSDRSGYPTLYRVRLGALATNGVRGEALITRPYSVSEFAWKDNSTILFTANRDSIYQWALYAYTPATGALAKVTDSTTYDSAFVRAGGNIIFNRIEGDARLPYAYQLATGTVKPFALPGVSADTEGYRGNAVRAGALSGVWHKPDEASKTLLVWLHGGPYRQASLGYHPYFSYAGYDWILEQLVEKGVAVLKLDYPGSAGQGRPFAESITGQVGTRDVAATLAATEAFAREHGYTDVHLAGNSYGGYLALKLLAEHPESFEGAFSINGVTDWDVLTRNLVSSIFNVQFGGLRNPANDHLYQNASIVDQIDNLKGETIVLAHGTQDRSVPYTQSVLLANALENADIDATLLTFEGEDHVYAKGETFEELCEALMEFVSISPRGSCEL